MGDACVGERMLCQHRTYDLSSFRQQTSEREEMGKNFQSENLREVAWEI
jgi:hypothetical protein